MDKILSAVGGMKGGKKAAGVQNANLEWLKNVYNTTSSQYQPFIQGGTGAFNNIIDMLTKGDMSSFFESPNYNFALQEGQNAVSNQLAKYGLRGGTAAAKGMDRFSQGLATNQFQTFLNNLFKTSEFGTNSIQGLGNIGASLAPSMTGQSNSLASTKFANAALPWQTASNIFGDASSVISQLPFGG